MSAALNVCDFPANVSNRRVNRVITVFSFSSFYDARIRALSTVFVIFFFCADLPFLRRADLSHFVRDSSANDVQRKFQVFLGIR